MRVLVWVRVCRCVGVCMCHERMCAFVWGWETEGGARDETKGGARDANIQGAVRVVASAWERGTGSWIVFDKGLGVVCRAASTWTACSEAPVCVGGGGGKGIFCLSAFFSFRSTGLYSMYGTMLAPYQGSVPLTYTRNAFDIDARFQCGVNPLAWPHQHKSSLCARLGRSEHGTCFASSQACT